MLHGSWGVWLDHFEYHARQRRDVRPDTSDFLTPAEHRRVAASIATFQLGERSAGRSLLRAAERFAAIHGLPVLPRIVELLIREEQRHAEVLKEFLEDHGMALLRSHWTDRIFRRVRRLAGLELYLHVLLCAELVGIVYYRALEAATQCLRLRALCRGLVADELAHVGFESGLLLALHARHVRGARALLRRAHRLSVAATARVVWQTHRAVLRPAGHDVRSFVDACVAQYVFYLESPVALVPQHTSDWPTSSCRPPAQRIREVLTSEGPTP